MCSHALQDKKRDSVMLHFEHGLGVPRGDLLVLLQVDQMRKS